MARKPVGYQQIEDRRERESQQRFLDQANALDTRTRQRETFEKRTNNRFHVNELKRRAEQRQKEYLDVLDERRDQLRYLLTEEDYDYHQSILGNVETPEKRKQRIIEKIRLMKEALQKEHDDIVAEKMEQGWRDGCDELRTQISRQFEKNCLKERDQQLIENRIKKEKADMEEERWAKEVQRQLEKHKDDALFEKQDRDRKIARNKTIWLSQIAAHEEKAAKEKEELHQEGLRAIEQTERQRQQDIEDQKKKAELQLARRKELNELNQRMITRKNRELQAEKDADMEFARQNAESLRKFEEERLVNNLVRRAKGEENKILLASQLGKKQGTDNESQMYLDRAQKEMNQKEDDRRARDATLRKNLLLDAVADRVKTMKLHDKQKEGLKEVKKQEAIELERELAEKKKNDDEEHEANRRRVQLQFSMIEKQCALKKQQMEQRKREEDEEAAQRIAAWKNEEAKIQEALRNPELLSGTKFHGFR